jgi:N-acetylmuramoyl-L-alanine amidase
MEGEVKPDTKLDKIVWRALLQEYYTQSKMLAEKIISSFRLNVNDDNRGIHNHRDFRVITWTRCPAVLIEIGFMSNRMTARKLATDSYRQDIAKAIAEGILEFKKEFDKKNGFTKSGDKSNSKQENEHTEKSSTKGTSDK